MQSFEAPFHLMSGEQERLGGLKFMVIIGKTFTLRYWVAQEKQEGAPVTTILTFHTINSLQLL